MPGSGVAIVEVSGELDRYDTRIHRSNSQEGKMAK